MKTNKSYSKRLKITKNGKIIARTPGHCHFNAKESGSVTRQKKNPTFLKLPKKVTRRFLSNQ